MPISIPQSVFDKYYDVVDSTFNIFGVTCQLVYIDKVEEISNSFNNLSSNHSVNAHRRPQDNYKRQNKVFREVEKTEDIKLKVYWDNKSWVKVGGDMVIPANSIQTIFYATDLPKITKNWKSLQNGLINKMARFARHFCWPCFTAFSAHLSNSWLV